MPLLNAFDPTKHITWGDVAVNDPHSPDTLKVSVKRSKTDQLGRGVDVYVGKTGCYLCPVTAVLAYMARRGNVPGPFFKFDNGQALTKSTFTQRVRSALQSIGLPYQLFAGHSFRIGAATTAAKAGIEDSKIRIMGRWNSSAFLVYVRTPREELAQFGASLAQQ